MTKAIGTPLANVPSGIRICDQWWHSTGCTSTSATQTLMPQVIDTRQRWLRSGNKTVVVRLALFADQPLVRFLRVVAGEYFLFGIPFHRLVHAHGDHAEVRHGDGTMADFHV